MDTLIQQGLTGDANALNQLVSAYQAFAYKVARRLLRDKDDVADAVQESLIKVVRALPHYSGGQFHSWLARIVTNTCYDFLRAARRRQSMSLDDLTGEAENNPDLRDRGEQPEPYVERMEIYQWLKRGLGALSADQRQVVVLYDVEGYSYEQIAAMTGVPIGTVKSRLNRGRVNLRNFLLDHQVLTV